MRASEKAMKAFQDYTDKLGDDFDKDNLEEYIQKFMEEYNHEVMLKKEGKMELTDEEIAYDLYDEAIEESDYNHAKRLLRKAIKLKPDFTDAKVELLTFIDDDLKRIRELEKLEKIEKEKLMNEGYFTEKNIPHFYGILETRPYIRLLNMLAIQYQGIGSYRKAMEIYENIIYLNENDNTGSRYSLMGIYTLLEDKEKMEKIINKYPEDSIPVHLFQFVLAYKLLDYTKARRHLRAIQREIPDFKKLINGDLNEDDLVSQAPKGYYSPYSIEEVLIYMNEFSIIFMNETLLDFMRRTLKK